MVKLLGTNLVRLRAGGAGEAPVSLAGATGGEDGILIAGDCWVEGCAGGPLGTGFQADQPHLRAWWLVEQGKSGWYD